MVWCDINSLIFRLNLLAVTVLAFVIKRAYTLPAILMNLLACIRNLFFFLTADDKLHAIFVASDDDIVTAVVKGMCLKILKCHRVIQARIDGHH